MIKDFVIGYNILEEDRKNIEDFKSYSAYFRMEDNSFQVIHLYEPYGCFKSGDQWVVYGHEEIKTFNLEGELIANRYTR